MDFYDRQGQPISRDRWMDLYQDSDYKRVALAKEAAPGVDVSTVWLGLNHGWSGDAAPIIFETMVFGGPMDSECERYATEAAARAGHVVMVDRVRAAVSS